MKTQKSVSTEPNRPQTIRFDYKAIVRLSQGTAAVVGTFLALLDTIALLPERSSLDQVLIDFAGLWISAAVLWFVGFQALIFTLGLCLGPIVITDKGLRLGHYGRLIEWSNIEAIALEPQAIFSKVCSLKPTAIRLTLFEKRKDKIISLDLPSFFYSWASFNELVNVICQRCQLTRPNWSYALLSNQLADAKLKESYSAKARQRTLIIAFIAVGLISVKARSTTVNYSYNKGNHFYHLDNFEAAKESYRSALAIDPTFTFAWSALAASEFHTNNFEAAAQDWHRALLLKPDFVEPKVGLAHMLIQNGKLDKAKEYLARALRRDPRNSAALLNMAEIALRTGKPVEALRIARLVLTDDPENPFARDVVQRAKDQLGL